MTTIDKNIEKRDYSTPQIECVELDNEISLALESTPPDGPGEAYNVSSDYFNQNPLNT